MLYLFVGKDTTFSRNFQGFREKCKRRSPTSEKKRSEVEPGISMPVCEEPYLHQ